MDNITSIVLAIFASSGLWTLIQHVYDNHKKKKTPQEQMIMAIGRDRILFLSKTYMKMGYIPDDEFDNFKLMGEAYIAMDGNTSVKRKYLDAVKLNTK